MIQISKSKEFIFLISDLGLSMWPLATVIRLAFCDGADSLVGWLTTLRDGDSLVLFITIVICFLLRGDDSLG